MTSSVNFFGFLGHVTRGINCYKLQITLEGTTFEGQLEEKEDGYLG